MKTETYITLCHRCNGTGKYDRGACFGCRQWGAFGFTRRKSRRGRAVVVTAIRDKKEGRIPWISIYGATPEQALSIVRRVQAVKGISAAITDTLQAG